MVKIIPHLWYDREAKEAAEFYTGIFGNSKILNTTVIEDTPSGDAEMVSFQLEGQEFAAISAGPFFAHNPAISFMVSCNTAEEVDHKHAALSQGGMELMPLDEYPFSKRYAWVQDRYGVSWQLMQAESAADGQKITPNLLFTGGVCGKAEEAANYYTVIFRNSRIDLVSHYKEGEAKTAEAKTNFIGFQLEGMSFAAMDNGYDADYGFTEAISFIISCKDQEEIDFYWSKLSAVPEAEQCGWLKDQYGVSWQVTPENMNEIMYRGTQEEKRRVTEAFLKMKKFDLHVLEQALLGL